MRKQLDVTDTIATIRRNWGRGTDRRHFSSLYLILSKLMINSSWARIGENVNFPRNQQFYDLITKYSTYLVRKLLYKRHRFLNSTNNLHNSFESGLWLRSYDGLTIKPRITYLEIIVVLCDKLMSEKPR